MGVADLCNACGDWSTVKKCRPAIGRLFLVGGNVTWIVCMIGVVGQRGRAGGSGEARAGRPVTSF